MEQKKIYEVAVYLRKSRDDTGGEEDVLLKHETALTDLVHKNNWRYVIYREIGSSDSIDFRPEFNRLLKDIENDFYDAVVVMDYDWLSRGDKEDRARVEKILQQSNTLAVTPQRVYDLNDEDQELITDIEGVFARYEYRMIKKRFQRGKKIGTRLGHWTYGPAPFPYAYDSEARSLQIDPEKLDVYNFIKRAFSVARRAAASAGNSTVVAFHPRKENCGPKACYTGSSSTRCISVGSSTEKPAADSTRNGKPHRSK